MTISELKDLMEAGQFHHATYRNHGTLWEGLHIYSVDPSASSSRFPYRHAAIFHKGTPELEEALKLTSKTGISIGAYGQG